MDEAIDVGGSSIMNSFATKPAAPAPTTTSDKTLYDLYSQLGLNVALHKAPGRHGAISTRRRQLESQNSDEFDSESDLDVDLDDLLVAPPSGDQAEQTPTMVVPGLASGMQSPLAWGPFGGAGMGGPFGSHGYPQSNLSKFPMPLIPHRKSVHVAMAPRIRATPGFKFIREDLKVVDLFRDISIAPASKTDSWFWTIDPHAMDCIENGATGHCIFVGKRKQIYLGVSCKETEIEQMEDNTMFEETSYMRVFISDGSAQFEKRVLIKDEILESDGRTVGCVQLDLDLGVNVLDVECVRSFRNKDELNKKDTVKEWGERWRVIVVREN